LDATYPHEVLERHQIAEIYFLGLRWLTTLTSSLLSGVGEEAVRLADHNARGNG